MAELTGTDRQICPRLAAVYEAYGLMLAAMRNNGEWTGHQFADAESVVLAAKTCVAEGFDVIGPSEKYPQTLSIKSRQTKSVKGAKEALAKS